jgi:serine protease
LPFVPIEPARAGKENSVTQVARAVLVASAVCATVVAFYPASVAHSTVATASKKNPAVLREPVIRQMIVKLRNPKAAELVQPLGAERVAALSTRGGVGMHAHRAMSGGASVLRLDAPLKLSDAKAVAARISADPDVLYAEPDLPVKAYQTVPPDVSFPIRQWHYFAPGQLFNDRGIDGTLNKNPTATGGANLPGAWNLTTGSSAIVVAVVDSGVTLNHPELAAAVLPGYDFVSTTAGGGVGGLPNNFIANDGNGRDADPSDPGDWITAAEKTNFPTECDDGSPGQTDSSWHGTHMAATIAGAWGNGVGANPPAGTSVAGNAPNVRLLPVRALGKCGGAASDVADAIVWAAGFAVPNAPANPTPARVINLSLGSVGGPCNATYNAAVTAVSGQALVIAASGNDGAIGVSSPANCPGALGVTAHTINGDNADYSNIGPEVGVSSPGGGTPTQLTTNPVIDGNDIGFYTWSAILFGAQGPASVDSMGRSGPAIGGFTGTSSATAHVSGIAALVLSMKPSATPAELRQILVSTARAHPAGGFCATGQQGANQCGSGLVDAAAAVSSVAPPPSSGGGGGGALPLAQLLLLGLFALVARVRQRG